MTDLPAKPRGADIVAAALAAHGCRTVFTLSGNHIMPIFDAALEAGLDLVHVRHEAAAVHMADAYGRLTGRPGVALVTGGPGHANAAAALFTALGAESPMVLLSGHAGLWEVGRGGFQELRQADMAAPVAKASLTATAFPHLARDIAHALALAASGRPGPVHLSLPFDLLEARGEAAPESAGAAAPRPSPALPEAVLDAVLAAIAAAERPLILAGPQLSGRDDRSLLQRLAEAVRAPAAVIESPRGLNDASLGAFGELIAEADLIVLLGKALDFTLKWLSAPVASADASVIVLEPDGALLARARGELGPRLRLGCLAEARAVAVALAGRAEKRGAARSPAWLASARAAMAWRPEAWRTTRSRTAGRLHPIEVFAAVRPILERNPDAVLICDGGEFSQWGQSLLPIGRRLINSVSGSIGASLPFALAARLVEPAAPVIAILGDGSFGFHMAEFETAARRKLPFVAIVGTDGAWNAERQIQIREYGPARAHGCDLLPVRYDLVAAALGGHGELVTEASALASALDRALRSGKPACVNVMIESVAAPVVHRPG